jgi:hypothetical protein
VGAAFDLFGTGRTAVKAFLNRYVNFEPITGITTATSPANLIATSATRNWSDTNGDYVPQETELGPLAPTTFGQVVRNTNYADDVLHGFGNRGYSWQTSAQIQHELRPGLGFSVGYFRTWYGNFQVTDNQLVAPGDFSEYCITAPSNAALPGGGGDRICGLYDVSLAKFGQTQNIVTQSSQYGKQSDVFSGVDITMNARFGEGGVLQGGVSTGSQVTDNCYANGDPSLTPQGASTTSITPRTPAFCHVSPPWSAGTQVKFSAIYPLPWQLQMAGTYQNNPPIPTTASLVATNAQILPSLGRNLASCGTRVPCNGTATIELITPGSFYQEPRIQQVDIRFSRNFRFRMLRAQPQFDIYNLFNANPVLAITTRYGSAWRNATTVLSPRVFKLGAKVDF